MPNRVHPAPAPPGPIPAPVAPAAVPRVAPAAEPIAAPAAEPAAEPRAEPRAAPAAGPRAAPAAEPQVAQAAVPRDAQAAALSRMFTGADVWDVDPRAHYRRHPGALYDPIFAAAELIGGRVVWDNTYCECAAGPRAAHCAACGCKTFAMARSRRYRCCGATTRLGGGWVVSPACVTGSPCCLGIDVMCCFPAEGRIRTAPAVASIFAEPPTVVATR